MPDALPRLSGRGLAAYRIVWAAALAAAAGAAAATQFRAVAPTRALEAAVLVTVSILLFRRRGGDAVAAMLSLAFLLWTATSSFVTAGMDAALIPLAILDRLRFLIFVSAMLLFPSGRFEPRWTRWAVAGTFAMFCVGVLEAVRLLPPGLYVPPAMGCAALAIAAMRARFVRLPPGVQRQQIKWVALGLGAGLALIGLARLGATLLPLVPDLAAPLPGLPTAAFDLGVTSIALGVLLSLLRFRLYDADAAISRSTAAAALTVVVVGIFAGTEAAIQSISQSLFGDMTGTISSGIAAAVAAAFIAPVHGRATGWAEQRFQREIVALRRELPEALADLQASGDLEALAKELLARLERGLRASRSALLLDDAPLAFRHVEAAELDAWLGGAPDWRDTPRDPDDNLFPLRVPLRIEGTAIFGWLLLGPRPDGSSLGRDERAAVTDLSGPAARALCALRNRRARERAGRRLIEAQAAAIAALALRLAVLEARPETAGAA